MNGEAPAPLGRDERTLRLVLAYDGASYVGWQRQAAGTSIQGLLEAALSRLDSRPVTVVGAGRTDAGVHALGQVARVRLRSSLATTVVCRALNAILPADIRVLSVEDVPASFHPRFDARRKRYQYWWWDGPVMPPALRTWCVQAPAGLDVGQMDMAAASLVGCHDFRAFQSAGSDVQTTIRTVFRARVTVPTHRENGDGLVLGNRLVPVNGRFVVFDIEADGFLRHMVRALAGTLVDVGIGRRSYSGMPELLAGQTRASAGRTAPAHGLVMVAVYYDAEMGDGPVGRSPGCRFRE